MERITLMATSKSLVARAATSKSLVARAAAMTLHYH